MAGQVTTLGATLSSAPWLVQPAPPQEQQIQFFHLQDNTASKHQA